MPAYEKSWWFALPLQVTCKAATKKRLEAAASTPSIDADNKGMIDTLETLMMYDQGNDGSRTAR